MSPMNNRLLVPQKLPLLLDYAPGAAAAYSLRSLSNSYVGPVVTVRRSTDSAEADFTADEVSDGTLAAWCSGGDGFVKTWHDQSGNDRDATQATTTAQPQIVDSGVLVTDDGSPAVQFSESPRYLNAGASGLGDRFSVFLIYRTLSSSASLDCLVNTYDSFQAGIGNKGLLSFENQNAFGVSVGTSTTNIRIDSNPYGHENETSLIAFVCDGPSGASGFSLRRNGAEIGTVTVTGGTTLTGVPHGDLTIGQAEIYVPGNPDRALDGYLKEILIYPTDMTALRTRIEADMAWYY